MSNTRRTFASAFTLLGGAALLGLVASGCGVGEVPETGRHVDAKVQMLASALEPGESGGGGTGETTDPGPTDGKFGSIAGRIAFTGTPPDLKFGNFTIAAGDVAVCKPELIGNEALVVGEGGGIQNCFVWLAKPPKVKPPAEEGTEPEASGPQVFNNVNCRFVPHCMVVESGETFLIKSEDATAHNTHTFPGAVGNNPVNTLVGKSQDIEATYKKPEKQPVFVKCDLHAWMKAYHLVVPDKDYAAVTKADGSFELKNLPYGTHTLTIWHESGVNERVKVTVDAESVTFEKAYGAGDFEIANLPASREVVLALGE